MLPKLVHLSAVPRWSHRDPVEGGNPFPPADLRSEAWDAATADARQTLLAFDARLAATAQVTLDPAIYRAQLLDLAVGRFDVWARRGLAAIGSDADDRPPDYEQWLGGYVANWLRYVAETCPRVEVGNELQSRLDDRARYWATRARGSVRAVERAGRNRESE
jgi:hypothetical protein